MIRFVLMLHSVRRIMFGEFDKLRYYEKSISCLKHISNEHQAILKIIYLIKTSWQSCECGSKSCNFHTCGFCYPTCGFFVTSRKIRKHANCGFCVTCTKASSRLKKRLFEMFRIASFAWRGKSHKYENCGVCMGSCSFCTGYKNRKYPCKNCCF